MMIFRRLLSSLGEKSWKGGAKSALHNNFKTLSWVFVFVLSGISVVFSSIGLPLWAVSKISLSHPSRTILLLLSFFWFVLFFAFLRKLPLWFRSIFLAIFFFPVGFSIFLRERYGMEIEYGFVLDAVTADLGIIFGFFSLSAILTVLVYFLGATLISWILGKLDLSFPKSKISILVLVVALILSANQPNFRAFISPVKISLDVKDFIRSYFSGDKVFLDLLSKSEDLLQEFEVVPEEISKVHSEPIVVLHIGESSRADHAPFNGYNRNTMPFCLTEFKLGNLISFPTCVSFSNKTVLSVRGILSPSTVLDNAFRYPTFIPVLNQNGIETIGLFSRGGLGSDVHEKGSFLAFKSLSRKVRTTDYSASLLPEIEKEFTEINSRERRFFLYYGEGSHSPRDHYDFKKFSKFTPNGHGNFHNKVGINNYDNTFVATDYFIGKFFDILRNENAIYIFVGDHGEMLGEGGMWGRPFKQKEVRHVLFFIWASEKFKSENPEIWETFLKNYENLKIISHDFVYNSILHLFSIKTPYYDEKADLFSETAEAFPTEMPEAKEFGEMRFGAEAKSAGEWKIMLKKYKGDADFGEKK